MRKLSIALLVTLALTLAAAQQDKSKRPSPPGTAEVTLSGHKITVDYSRPKIADPKTGQPRKIFGGLVPFGQVWRTGANDATSLKTDVALDIGGTAVPAGSYTLFTLPSESGWKLIVNRQTGQWGTEYDPKQDLARIPMKGGKIDKTVDPFTISFDKKSDSEATLHLAWESTDVWVGVKLKR
ncbi:MAG TPA: DUF2911 domain-containing protein [Terriglobales bacterium]|nr:DUF2911 domain-containing protein [Terriglobales bacterium]